jgi:hypothetical protein
MASALLFLLPKIPFCGRKADSSNSSNLSRLHGIWARQADWEVWECVSDCVTLLLGEDNNPECRIVGLKVAKTSETWPNGNESSPRRGFNALSMSE